MIYQILCFFKHCFILIRSNILRFIFSLLGIVISLIIYLLGSILVYSYSQTAYSEYQDFDRNTALINGDIPSEFIKNVELNIPNLICAKYMAPISLEVCQLQQMDVTFTHQTDIIGVTANFTSIPITSTEADNKVYWTNIVMGRDISQKDIQARSHVAVISQYASKVYFGKENAIGELIKVALNNDDEDCSYFRVVGIYKDTPLEKNDITQCNELLKTNRSSINLFTNVYVPYSVLNFRVSDTQGKFISAVYYLKDIDQCTILNKIARPYLSSISINTYNSHIERISLTNKSMGNILSIATVIIIILSGINLMNCMLFSIKERFCEIGIRKAMGAPDYAISFQFTIETLITCFFGIIIGFIITTYVLIALRSLLTGSIDIYINVNIYIRGALLTILQGVVFSIIPALYASKIKVVDALRQD